MRLDDIREWLRRMPFRPFRFYVLEMTTYEVYYPEMVIVRPATIDLNPPSEAGTEDSRPMVTIALMHITKLELLSLPPSVSQNGTADGESKESTP